MAFPRFSLGAEQAAESRMFIDSVSLPRAAVCLSGVPPTVSALRLGRYLRALGVGGEGWELRVFRSGSHRPTGHSLLVGPSWAAAVSAAALLDGAPLQMCTTDADDEVRRFDAAADTDEERREEGTEGRYPTSSSSSSSVVWGAVAISRRRLRAVVRPLCARKRGLQPGWSRRDSREEEQKEQKEATD
eukprot:GHVU01169554.1.p1 GENE.GHVU01169554.1~~GHVU01169554.1.p1  ORF type:complete len:215 (-),score=43.78 GHVU01169554.1:70-633(-)